MKPIKTAFFKLHIKNSRIAILHEKYVVANLTISLFIPHKTLESYLIQVFAFLSGYNGVFVTENNKTSARFNDTLRLSTVKVFFYLLKIK
jgi:hypothetical protein